MLKLDSALDPVRNQHQRSTKPIVISLSELHTVNNEKLHVEQV